MEILRIIGSNVRKYRLRASLSQEKLAEICGLHRTYIGAVERAERNVSAVNIGKIAAALNLEPYRLLKKAR